MTISPAKLLKELQAAGIPAEGCNSNGRIDFLPEATQAHRDQAAALLAAHDPTDIGAQNADDIRARWKLHTLKGKSPAQIYAAMQAQIDAWPSLAAAKADLREWLPLIVATLAWIAVRDVQE